MARLLNQPCGCASVQPTIIVYDDGTSPPTIGNVVAIPKPGAQRPWAGTAGAGIKITQPFPDGNAGMTPTIELAVSPNSPVKLTFDSAGRLTAGPVDVEAMQTALVINGGVTKQGGLEVAQGGTKGHAVTIQVVQSAQSSLRVGVGGDGGMKVDPPAPFIFETVVAAGNTRTFRIRNTVTNATFNVCTI